MGKWALSPCPLWLRHPFREIMDQPLHLATPYLQIWISRPDTNTPFLYVFCTLHHSDLFLKCFETPQFREFARQHFLPKFRVRVSKSLFLPNNHITLLCLIFSLLNKRATPNDHKLICCIDHRPKKIGNSKQRWVIVHMFHHL